MKFTLGMILEARERLKGVAQRTGLVQFKALSDEHSQIYLKTEDLQNTGSFKVRGAYFKISQLSDEEKAKGVIACSAGNHAQGVGFASRDMKIPATICIPAAAPISKIQATRSYGANVVLVDGVYDDAYAEAVRLRDEQGLTFIHPFDDYRVMAGQGTIGLEILEQLPDVDVILVPIGGGGLAAGVSTLAKLLNPNVKVIGVEPEGAACMKASLEAGHVVSLPTANTIADGTAVKTPGDKVFPYIRDHVDQIITIPDTELVEAFLDVMEKHKMVVENSGLLSVAALRHLSCQGLNVVCVLSGGNMDVITMSSLVQHGLIMRGRIFTFSVLLPDRPGALLSIADILARENGNVIKLEHNQFVNINRQSGVELKVTLEAFGHDHKDRILEALSQAGYQAHEVDTTDFYH